MPRLRKEANISRQTANRRRDNYNAMIQQAVTMSFKKQVQLASVCLTRSAQCLSIIE